MTSLPIGRPRSSRSEDCINGTVGDARFVCRRGRAAPSIAALAAVAFSLVFTGAPAIARSGRQLWLRRYDDPKNAGDQARAIAVGPKGSRVFVTGGSDSGGLHGDDYVTVAYTASGKRIWTARYTAGIRRFTERTATSQWQSRPVPTARGSSSLEGGRLRLSDRGL
jgi:hypothetical protein